MPRPDPLNEKNGFTTMMDPNRAYNPLLYIVQHVLHDIKMPGGIFAEQLRFDN